MSVARVTLARLPIEDEHERRRGEEKRRADGGRHVSEAGTCHVRIHITYAHEQ
jgi:hypothetical protein